MARPRGSDLPAFPTPSQFQSSQQQGSSRPSASRPVAAAPLQSRPPQAHPHGRASMDAGYRQDPRYDPRQAAVQNMTPQMSPGIQTAPPLRHSSQGYDARASTDSLAQDLRHTSISSSSRQSTMSGISTYSQQTQRAPVLGIQPGHGRGVPANFHGQAFGIAPDTNREPPYDKVLWKLFCQVDSDGSGAISPKELSNALITGTFQPFNLDTVHLMVRLFDEDRSGTICFAEFAKLWAYLLEWQELFKRFDVNASGTISFVEFQEALAAFGYRLSTEFSQFLFRHHERDRKQRSKEMTFDLFVQACILLRSYTEIFKAFDTDQDGVITIGFEDFLRVLIKNRS